jgi:hypothetical protein
MRPRSVRYLLSALVAVLLVAGALPAATAAPPERRASVAAPTGTPVSELRLGGRLVAYVGWSQSSNTFTIADAYPDNQSAVVRFRVGTSTRVHTRWHHGGSGTQGRAAIDAGALTVRFKACRSSSSGVSYQCTKRWTAVPSSCLKGGWTKAYYEKGACVTATAQVRFGDGHPHSGWAYRMRGIVTDPAADGKNARLEARTHLHGDSWTKPFVVAGTTDGRWKSYDEVLYRGGRKFFFAFRVCGNGCGRWTEGDVGLSGRALARPAPSYGARRAIRTHVQDARVPGYSVYCRFDAQLLLADHGRSEGCFDSSGDYFAVLDDKYDGRGVAILWRMADGSKRGICRNFRGSRPVLSPWPTCNFDSVIPEGRRIVAWLSSCEVTAQRNCRQWGHYPAQSAGLKRTYRTTHPADGG